MSKPLPLASLLLVTTILYTPAALAQTAPAAPAQQTPPPAEQPAAEPETAQEPPVEVSVPGGGPEQDVVVTAKRQRNIVRDTQQVVSLLSSADIARTGEGDIAGALARVTGLSVVGNGFVYVRGLGDRYSLALLNGSPLPSPEPLKRVVPLDIFPTDVIASSLVQKSYSANYPAEFGGGVINLTTIAVPKKPFFSFNAGISGDTVTTGQLGFTYFGTATDWSGFGNGGRTIPAPLQAALNSGRPILRGADFSTQQLQTIASSLDNARSSLVQRFSSIPINFSGDFSAGTSTEIGDVTLGIIAAAGISNRWLSRDTLNQFSRDPQLAGNPQRSIRRVITDNNILVNGMLGFGVEVGRHKFRWTNLYIRDTVKQTRLGTGTDEDQQGRTILVQDTGWYARQLIDTQVVGELDFNKLKVDFRGGYAQSQRDAPYERSFTYSRSNVANDPFGQQYLNDLGNGRGSASVAFNNLVEDLYSLGLDATYKFQPELTIGVGYAYTDTSRTSVRRGFDFRPVAPLPITVQQLRPDFLLSPFTIQNFGITLLETTAQEGTAAFGAGLKVHAGYLQIIAQPTPELNITTGVRYETSVQTVNAIDLFNTGRPSPFNTRIARDYFLPSVTATYQIDPQMQVRLSASRTLARPQFRELIQQPYIDTDSNRFYRGNPALVNSTLTNIEGRWEWYFAKDQRITASAFYKRIQNPIEVFSSVEADIITSFANAPSADLYGVELEAQKYVAMADLLKGGFWANRRLVLIGNYTYTNSRINVGANDTTIVNNRVSPARNFFQDGIPLTGQSDHLVNLQIGFEDTKGLSQQTFLINYASERVTQRGAQLQPDVIERPGFRLDFVARQGVKVGGVQTEIKFEARNITATNYQEFQSFGNRRVFYNLYERGAFFNLSAGVRF